MESLVPIAYSTAYAASSRPYSSAETLVRVPDGVRRAVGEGKEPEVPTEADPVSRVGIQSVKVAPALSRLRAVRSPPILRARRRLIARPSPVPPFSRVSAPSACTNGSNSLLMNDGWMPGPESVTRMYAQLRGSSFA